MRSFPAPAPGSSMGTVRPHGCRCEELLLEVSMTGGEGGLSRCRKRPEGCEGPGSGGLSARMGGTGL